MKILCVEDDKKLASFIARGLVEEGYTVDQLYSGVGVIEQIADNEYDLVLLDIMLPQTDGLTLCEQLRKNGETIPVIMLTAKTSVDDKINGLDSGADDYITKPFEFKELLARIKAHLRRTKEYKNSNIKIGDLELDTNLRMAIRGGKSIELTSKEFLLLEYLLEKKGQIANDKELIEKVWGMNFDPRTNIVNVYIHHLRRKIDQDFDVKLIHTRRGQGYYIGAES